MSKEQMIESREIRKVQVEDIPVLSGVLARSFSEDPVLDWFLRKDNRRGEVSRGIFETFYFPISIPHGEVYTTLDLKGAAIWLPPGKHRVGFFKELSLLPFFMRATGARSFISRMIGFQTMLSRHPKTPHFYLAILGTEPDYQGKGYGSSLLRFVLNIYDKRRLPTYLENSNERNLSFYKSFGFQVIETITMGVDGPTMWLMWRDPVI